MKTIYESDDYRVFLKDTIEARRVSDPDLTYSRIADGIGVQKSYLSNFFHGRTQLNSDQLFALAEELNLEKGERDYLLLLAEIDRCQNPRRKSELTQSRKKLAQAAQKSQKHFGAQQAPRPQDAAFAEYYGTALCPIVHMLLNVPEYLKAPKKIAERLSISDAQLGEVLKSLERCNVLEVTPSGYKLLSPDLFINDRSPFFRIYQTTARLRAVETLQRPISSEDHFFAATFSASAEVRAEAKKKFLEYLKWLWANVADAKDEDVFHVNFDLFRI